MAASAGVPFVESFLPLPFFASLIIHEGIVADPGCLFRFLTRITDPTSHKFHKIVFIFYFLSDRTNFDPVDKELKHLFTQNIVTKLSEIRVCDPRPEKTYPRSRIMIQGSKVLDHGSGSATLFERMLIANYALFSLTWDQFFASNVQDEPRQGQH